MARYWYAYNGVEDPFDTSSYEKFDLPNRPLCTTGTEICAVYASGSSLNSTPNNPFSNNLQQYIVRALTGSEVPQPNEPGAKPHVYLRN